MKLKPVTYSNLFHSHIYREVFVNKWHYLFGNLISKIFEIAANSLADLLFLTRFLSNTGVTSARFKLAGYWCFSVILQVSEYGVFSYPYSVEMWENMGQKKLRIWTLLTQWIVISRSSQIRRTSDISFNLLEDIFLKVTFFFIKLKNFPRFSETYQCWNWIAWFKETFFYSQRK